MGTSIAFDVMGGVTGRPATDMITELPEMKWATRAACRGMFEELSFWPPTSELHYQKAEQPGEKRQRESACKTVCAQCPVRGECLQWALAHHELGVWGGTTEDERRDLLRVGYEARELAAGRPWNVMPKPKPLSMAELARHRIRPRVG